MCNVDGFNILYLEVFRLNLSSTQTTPTVSTLCPSWYTVIGRRRPAHPVSVLILHLTDTRTPWSQLFDIEMLHCNALGRIKNATSCHPTGHVKNLYAHQQPTCIEWKKNDAKRGKRRQANKKWKKNNTRLTKGQNIEKYVCTYYEELFEQQKNPKNPRLIPDPERPRWTEHGSGTCNCLGLWLLRIRWGTDCVRFRFPRYTDGRLGELRWKLRPRIAICHFNRTLPM